MDGQIYGRTHRHLFTLNNAAVIWSEPTRYLLFYFSNACAREYSLDRGGGEVSLYAWPTSCLTGFSCYAYAKLTKQWNRWSCAQWYFPPLMQVSILCLSLFKIVLPIKFYWLQIVFKVVGHSVFSYYNQTENVGRIRAWIIRKEAWMLTTRGNFNGSNCSSV